MPTVMALSINGDFNIPVIPEIIELTCDDCIGLGRRLLPSMFSWLTERLIWSILSMSWEYAYQTNDNFFSQWMLFSMFFSGPRIDRIWI